MGACRQVGCHCGLMRVRQDVINATKQGKMNIHLAVDYTMFKKRLIGRAALLDIFPESYEDLWNRFSDHKFETEYGLTCYYY